MFKDQKQNILLNRDLKRKSWHVTVPATSLHFCVVLKSGWNNYIADSHPLQDHLEPQTVPGFESVVLAFTGSDRC